MAAASGGTDAAVKLSVEEQPRAERLFAEGYAFDFFQAVRLLERLDPARRQVGAEGPPGQEAVRFRAHLSLTFPPSSIDTIEKATTTKPPAMTVAFMGLTGPSGVLPRNYTELLLRVERERKDRDRFATRDWFDLFNHRFISLFYRAWTKYRLPIAYERGSGRSREDAFTTALFCLIGLGEASLRHRVRVVAGKQTLAQVEDLGLLRYAGFLAHRPRNAASLEAMLRDHFGLSVQVQQFQGQWLRLGATNCSRLGSERSNNQMAVDLVAGDRVYDCQSKFRLRVGPLAYAQFLEFLPDSTPAEPRKAFFLLCQLTRLYVGAEFDFDIQLVLRAADVPECQLTDGDGPGPRLGWNTWVRSQPYPCDADEPVFESQEGTQLG